MRKESGQDLHKLPREDSRISKDRFDIKKFRKGSILTRGTVLMGR
jgi:hypothetical protein